MTGERDWIASDTVGRRVYGLLLRAYPASFRRRFGDEMLADFDRMMVAARREGVGARVRAASRLLGDWFRSVVRERSGSGSRLPRGSRGGGPPVLFELRQALRRIRAAPGFAAVVVLVLALGLGPATAAYSIADGLLFRPLPGVSEQDDLAMIWHGQEHEGGGISPWFLSYPDLEEIAARVDTLAGLAGIQGGTVTIVLESGAAESLRTRYVMASYFPVLGLRPTAGRVFHDEEDYPRGDGGGLAIVSSRLAVSMFGGAEDAVGATLRSGGQDLEVIGVLPGGFHGVERYGDVDVWRPGAQRPLRGPGSRGPDANLRTDRTQGAFYEMVARLAPGATWEQVDAELDGLGEWLAETFPEDADRYANGDFLVYPGVGTPALGREPLERTIWLIGAIALAVLAIASANAAGLLFIRSLAQRGQLAVQKALGASRGRLARQVLLESALLCGTGAGVGLLVAATLLRIFEGTRMAGLRQPLEVGVDWRVALFAVLVSLLVAIAASFLAASEALRLDPARWVTGSARSSTGRGRRWQALLGAVQIAVSVPLVVGALLFGQTLWELAGVDLGFDPTGLRVVSFDPTSAGLVGPDSTEYLVRLAERLEGQAVLESAAVAERFPFVCCRMSSWVQRVGEDDRLDIQENGVTGDYFETMGIPLLAGRTFADEEILDYEGQDFGVVILNRSAAEALFGDPRGAVGKEVEFPYRVRQGLTYRVVGVVGDVRVQDLTGEPPAAVYTPLGPMAFMMGARLVGRTRVGDAGLIEAVVRAAAIVDPGRSAHPMEAISSIGEAIDEHLSERRLLANLFALLSFIGLLLAAVGLATAAARNVVVRTREIGVRKALGAGERNVLGTVLRDLIVVVLLGGVAGTGLTLVGVRWIESRLYGVATADPVTWLGTAALLAAVAFVAGVLPARRAVRIDPVDALRHDG